MFEDASIEDGRLFEVTLDAQPTEPEQLCTLVDFGGMISGDDFLDVVITCEAPLPEDEPADEPADDDTEDDDTEDDDTEDLPADDPSDENPE